MIKRAKVENGYASDFDACYLDQWEGEGKEVVDVLIDDRPDGYVGAVAWDPVLSRIYPHPDEKSNQWIELEKEKAALVGIRDKATVACQAVIDGRVAEIDVAKVELA